MQSAVDALESNTKLHSSPSFPHSLLSLYLSYSLSDPPKHPRPIPELILFNLPIVKVNERLTMTSLTDLYMNHVVVGPSIYPYLPLSLCSLSLSLSFAPFLHGIHGLLARIRSWSLLTEQQFLCFSCYYYSVGTIHVDRGGRWMGGIRVLHFRHGRK